MRLSGLQKEVLALYRQCLRESRKKPQSTRAHFEKFARGEFSRNMGIDKRDFAAVEFLLRKGRRQVDVYSSPGIKDISNRNGSNLGRAYGCLLPETLPAAPYAAMRDATMACSVPVPGVATSTSRRTIGEPLFMPGPAPNK